MIPEKDQLNLALLAAAAGIVVLAALWRARRFISLFRSNRSDQENYVTASGTTETAVTNSAPATNFKTLYDEVLSIPTSANPSTETAQTETDEAADRTFPDSVPETLPARLPEPATGTMVLNEFRKALDDGMSLPAAARRHGLTEDEARVAALCYSSTDS